MKNDGPVVLILGVSKGIGLATALELLSTDAIIYGVSRTKPLNEQLLSSPRFFFSSFDLRDSKGARNIVKDVLERWNRINCIIYNAGTLEPLSRLEHLKSDEFLSSFHLNTWTMMEIIQEALPMLRKEKAKVIAVSSGAAVKARQGWGSYCIAKASMNMMMQAWAVEEPDVVFIAFRPGVVDTDMQKLIREKGRESMGTDHEAFLNLDLLDPQVPARALTYLAFKASSSQSGQFVDLKSLEFVPFWTVQQ